MPRSPVRLDAWQRDLAHFGQHGQIGPRRLGHEVQQRLVFRRCSRRCGQRGHGLDTLPITRQKQAGTVVVQRNHAVGMADHAGQVLDVDFEAQTAGLACEEIHDCLRMGATNLRDYRALWIRTERSFTTQ